MQKLLMLLIIFVNFCGPLTAQERPNILWITVEDMSPTLGCYGDKQAKTPFLDSFSKKSVNYSNAFATSPVCSPSRSCLINGVYAQSQGTHQMRSAYKIPDIMKGFPYLLKKAGYYTTNNVKTDYNSANFQQIIDASWDQSSNTADWRGRKKGQPFFSVINLMTTHQSRTMVWPYEQFQKEIQSKLKKEEICDPETVKLPPYYPDTPVVRKTVARFYDCVAVMDKEVKDILQRLKDDGLAEDTIVFFYSDHGSGMPRHKRTLYDTGMKVPLMIHFPEKYKHLAPKGAGEWTDRLVSFVDFGPTVLSLLGVKVPDYMQGLAFLGEQEKPEREYIFGHRDRVDEVIDMSRSIRTKKYLYIRHYMPHLSLNAPTAWPDQGEIRHEIYKAANSGKMTPEQWLFARPDKSCIELFDCEKDPLNLNNISSSLKNRRLIQGLKNELKKHMLEIKDCGFIPEALEAEIDKKKLVHAVTQSSAYDLEKVIKSAEEIGSIHKDDFKENLKSANPLVRYWAVIGLHQCEIDLPEYTHQLQFLLNDELSAVRIESAKLLIDNKQAVNNGLQTLKKELKSENFATLLHAARTVELLGPKASTLFEDMKALDQRMKNMKPEGVPATVVQSGDIDMAMFIGFSTNAFLSKLEPEDEMVSLFDGKTLNGWKARSQGQHVHVENGEIQLLSKKTNLWLVHEKEFENFELFVEAKMPKEGYNSGIGFRCTGEKKPLGYQCEIDQKKSGSIYAIGKGWVLPAKNDGWEDFYKVAGDCFKPGEWNEFRIRCSGNKIKIWINGHMTADIVDDRFKKGQIALQHHGKGDMHYFRNIKIKVLE